jgi:hypothetical protein
MHVLINVKSANNISKWQMGFNSAFKRLKIKDMTVVLGMIHPMFSNYKKFKKMGKIHNTHFATMRRQKICCVNKK